MKPRALFLVALSTFALIFTACDATKPYAAKVDSRVIPNDAFVKDLESYFANPEQSGQIEAQLAQQGMSAQPGGKNTANQAFVSRVLTDEINTELLRLYNSKHSLAVTDVEREAARQAVGSVPQSQMPPDVLNRQVDAVAQRSVATRDFIAKNPDAFRQVCLRLIVTDTQAKADAIQGRVQKGEDFAEIARKESLASGERGRVGNPDGGLLPCVFPEEVPAPIAQLQPGQVSQTLPVQQYGFFVFQGVEQRAAPSYDELRASNTGLQGLVERMVPHISKGYNIEVNPRYGTLVRNENGNTETVAVQAPQSRALREGSAKSQNGANSGDMGSIFQQLQQPDAGDSGNPAGQE